MNELSHDMKMLKTSDGTVLGVYVKPNSREFKIEITDDELTVFCQEPPIKGRVNRELVKELSKVFHAKVEILSGLTSRQKRILIRDTKPEEISQIVFNYLKG